MQVNVTQAISMIAKYIRAFMVPMIEGSPGIGKSDVARKIAQMYNLKLIDLRLSQCDPTDLLGFPQIANGRGQYAPMSTFPIESDPLPEGHNGWLLFLDEFNSAPLSVQAAAYKIVLDRMVGQYHLHKNVAIICAGNKETDNAIVQPLSTALQSRLVHMELVVDSKQWIEWAATEGVDPRITGYIGFKPGNLYTFHPDHTDKTYACPRTWMFVNKVLKTVEITEDDALPMLAGTISEGVAREFIGFCHIFGSLPKIEQILANPETIPVSQEPSVSFAISSSIAHNATKANIEKLMKYVVRMSSEFQVICLRETVQRNRELMAHPSVIAWSSTTGLEYF